MGIAQLFGRAFKPSAYEARIPIPLGALQAASTHDRLLVCEVTTVAEKEVQVKFKVGGVQVTGFVSPATVKESREIPFCIIIPAGLEWELAANAGIKEVFGNLLNLS